MNRIIFFAVLIFVMNLAPLVFAANQFIPGEQLEVMAREEIEKNLEMRGEIRRREISLQRPLQSINLPTGIIDIKIQIPSATVNYVGGTPIQAQIFINKQYYRDVNFIMLVKVYDTVVVANHDLRIETPVTEGDFHVEEIPVDGRTDYLRDVQEIVGLVPHRLIRTGSPVTAGYFQQPVVVTTNQPVKIIVRYKGIVVSANGSTLTRGRIGEMIRVKNDASKKIVSAKVIDSQTVEVVL